MVRLQKTLQIILISLLTASKSIQSTNSIKECNIENEKKIKFHGHVEISVDFCFKPPGISMEIIEQKINDHFDSSANLFYEYFGVEFEKNINFLYEGDFGDEKKFEFPV